MVTLLKPWTRPTSGRAYRMNVLPIRFIAAGSAAQKTLQRGAQSSRGHRCGAWLPQIPNGRVAKKKVIQFVASRHVQRIVGAMFSTA